MILHCFWILQLDHIHRLIFNNKASYKKLISSHRCLNQSQNILIKYHKHYLFEIWTNKHFNCTFQIFQKIFNKTCFIIKINYFFQLWYILPAICKHTFPNQLPIFSPLTWSILWKGFSSQKTICWLLSVNKQKILVSGFLIWNLIKNLLVYLFLTLFLLLGWKEIR